MPENKKPSFLDRMNRDIKLSPFKLTLIFIVNTVVFILIQRFFYNR